jgi:hypothetical protein
MGATAIQRSQWRADVACAPDTTLLAKAFEVREIDGILKVSAGYLWGPDVHVLVEIVGKAEPTTTRIAQTDSEVRFRVKDVPEGDYRFRVGTKELGWACTQGTIVVSKKAPAKSTVQVTLRLGR